MDILSRVFIKLYCQCPTYSGWRSPWPRTPAGTIITFPSTLKLWRPYPPPTLACASVAVYQRCKRRTISPVFDGPWRFLVFTNTLTEISAQSSSFLILWMHLHMATVVKVGMVGTCVCCSVFLLCTFAACHCKSTF